MCKSYIYELPEIIRNKKACVNFENKDEYCFIYPIRCAIDVYNKKKLHYQERVKQYQKYITDKIFSEYEYPMSLKDIRNFQKEVSINLMDILLCQLMYILSMTKESLAHYKFLIFFMLN